METKIFNVEGMACGNCVKAITKAVGALSGVDSVSADLTKKTVTVKYDPTKTTDKDIAAVIEDQGFDVGD